MSIKKAFNKSHNLPVIGGVSGKDIVRWGVIGLGFGGLIFLAVRIPKIGPYIAEGLDSIRRYTPSNQL